MITNAERLKLAFSLFLTPAEAAIAAAASGQNSGTNPANSNGKQNDREFFQDLLQPIGRNG